MVAKAWNWKGLRWVYAYVVFSIINVALILGSNAPEIQRGGSSLIIAFVFFFATWCAKNDFDSNKKILQKVVWIIGLWIGQSLLGVLFLLGMAKAGLVIVATPILANMIAGFIILYLAMIRSTTFVSRTF